LSNIPDIKDIAFLHPCSPPQQGVTFYALLLVLPAGNLGIPQEIQSKFLVVPSKIVSEGGKGYFKVIYIQFVSSRTPALLL
jgi:hypothetical protein